VSIGTTVVEGTVVVGTVVVTTVVEVGVDVDGREVVVGAGLVTDALLLLPPQAARATLKHAARTQSLNPNGFITSATLGE
jgi:hypothetical protein